MSDWTIGVVSPKAYDHSAVFNDVAYTLTAALKDLGHRPLLSVINEDAPGLFDWPDENALLFGANLLPHYTIDVPSHARLFNLEQATSPWMGKSYLDLLRQHEVWDYSERNIEFLREAGIEAKLCRIGFHPCLTRIEPRSSENETIDVLFYGSNTPRRVEIIRAMCDLGVNVQCLFGCYGPERDEWISKAKVILNLHAYDRSPLEIVRLQLLFANRKCVLTETCAPDDPEYNLYRGCMGEGGNAEQLATVAKNLLADQSLRFRLGQLGYDAFKTRPQADYLKGLL